ncbi:head maturation protease, ClpP-related [Rhodococcus sp. JT-3]|uniref:head maturation protease, ClpP-related n=1 Tax=Rhodococcus sp. JT-3 TaxID=1973213 RepID=UPI001303D441|nr:head maturation protease, ClpP-related [Rhodococcus sp. JT-3]
MNRNVRGMRASARPDKHDWYQIRNAAEEDEGPAEILIYDEIGYGWYGGVSAQNFAKELGAISADEITVRLNSPGGDVYDGIAILNALRSHKARVTVYVDGLAASAASFIAMAGDEVVMRRNSEMMIHDASCLGIGNAGEMRKVADDLDRVSNNIASIYAERAGGTTDEWREIMLAETWYSAQEAVDAGLANRVDAKAETGEDDKAAAKNSFDLSIFNYAGRREAPAPPQIVRHEDRAGSRPSASHRAPTTPAARSVGSTRKGGSTVALTLTDEQETSVLEALGLKEGATADDVVTAVEELATAPEEGGSESENAATGATTARLPEGVVAVDADQFAALQAQAARGAAAAERQESEDRVRLVDDAIRAGKFPTAKREHWLNYLKADPKGGREVLASLAEGLIPVGESIGHAQEHETTVSDESLDDFAAQFGLSKGALRA